MGDPMAMRTLLLAEVGASGFVLVGLFLCWRWRRRAGERSNRFSADVDAAVRERYAGEMEMCGPHTQPWPASSEATTDDVVKAEKKPGKGRPGGKKP
jgi:hypothetical protein